MKILVLGGTGFIGGLLVTQLVQKGHKVIVLTRNPSNIQQKRNVDVLLWDGQSLNKIKDQLVEIQCVINLAGENIASKRWTKPFKEKITASRIIPNQEIVKAIKNNTIKPNLYIAASAIGYYEGNGALDVDEESPHGTGFLSQLCQEWEAEVLKASDCCRVCCLRIGVVLDKGGGFISKTVPPFKWFLGGVVGSGKQHVSWVHREDVVRSIHFIIETDSISGPINITAPKSETLNIICQRIGKLLSRPSWIRIPGMLCRLLVGEFANTMLDSQRIHPKKLSNNGFTFKYPYLTEALRDILKH